MIFSRLFLICLFKDKNLAENLKNLAEYMWKIFKKNYFHGTSETNFLHLWAGWKTVPLGGPSGFSRGERKKNYWSP